MTTHITKTWFDGEKLVTQEIAESEVYKQEPPVQFKCTVVDDQHPNGVPLSQWGNTPTPPAAQREPAPGYCKHCKQYTIEEPLPAAQRQWVGLTEAEINEWDYDTRDVVMDIEKLLREKNHG